MSTGKERSPAEIRYAHLGERYAHWSAVCFGEYCALCDTRVTDGAQVLGPRVEFHLCRSCHPNPSVAIYPMWINLGSRANEAWSLCFSSTISAPDEKSFALWLLYGTREEAIERAKSFRCSFLSLNDCEEDLRIYGHTSFLVFVESSQYDQLMAMARKDPRTAYAKRKALKGVR